MPTTEVQNQGSSQPTTDTVKRQDLIGYTFFDGKLVIPEAAQATAYSPYETPILTVMTGVGKHVDKGDPIVKLTIPGADAAAAAAKADQTTAQADYSTVKGDNSAPVREAQRVLAEAKAVEKAARETVANGGEADIEGATSTRVAAEATLQQVRQELRRSLEGSKTAVDQANSNLREARADAAKGLVRAPISGTVVTLTGEPGMLVTARQALATIVNFEAVRVQGLVPADLKDLVTKNSRVIIAMNGKSADTLDGVVVDIGVAPPSAGQESAGYLAIIQFLNPRAIAQPSSSVKRVGIKTGTASNVLVVPVGAITVREGKSFVNVQNGLKWVETPVKTGLSDGVVTEVKSGLTEGTVIQVVSQQEDAHEG